MTSYDGIGMSRGKLAGFPCQLSVIDRIAQFSHLKAAPWMHIPSLNRPIETSVPNCTEFAWSPRNSATPLVLRRNEARLRSWQTKRSLGISLHMKMRGQMSGCPLRFEDLILATHCGIAVEC